MEEFIKMLLKASLTAIPAACAVMLMRLLIRKASRRWAYMLWAVVFFRCLCPFSVESGLSIFNAVPELPAESRVNEISRMAETAVSPNIGAAEIVHGYQADYTGSYFDSTEILPQTEPEKPVDRYAVMFAVWLAGAAAMSLYGIISYRLMMNRLKTAVKAEDGVWESDRISTAFSAGFFPPKIYLPQGLFPEERRLIVTHERVHIKRLDHIAKLAAFIALTLHWFNPMIWLAFALMTRDMELSCDEAVLKILGADEKKAYSEALLRVAVRQSGFLTPAFAETGIKGRVRNVLKYKKPTVIATAFAAAAVVTVCVAFGTDAGSKSEEIDGSDMETVQTNENALSGESDLRQAEYEAMENERLRREAEDGTRRLGELIQKEKNSVVNVYVSGGDFIALFDDGGFDMLNVYGGCSPKAYSYSGAKDYRYEDNRLILSFSDGSELYFDVLYDSELLSDKLVYNDELSHRIGGGTDVPICYGTKIFVPDGSGSYAEFARIISAMDGNGADDYRDGEDALALYFSGNGGVLSLYSDGKFSYDNFVLSYFQDYYEDSYYIDGGSLMLTFTDGSELCFEIGDKKLTFRKSLSRYSGLQPTVVPDFSDGDVLEILGDGEGLVPGQLKTDRGSFISLVDSVSDGFISLQFTDLSELYFEISGNKLIFRKDLSRYSDFHSELSDGDLFEAGDLFDILDNSGCLKFEQVRTFLQYPVSADISEDYGYGGLRGLRFDVPKGTPVVAAADGVASEAADGGYNNGLGFYVKISHGADGIETVYAHLSEVTVKAGDEVKAGTVIGYSGSTGDTVSAGLFFQTLSGGMPENPHRYLITP